MSTDRPMVRTDHFQDPAAPEPTTIGIAACAFVLDAAARLLLVRRTDNGLHALPGGRHELGETVTGTAVRETAEETGVTIAVTGLIGVYSNPEHIVAFSDGRVFQEFSLCFRARSLAGEPRPSEETGEALWVERDRLDSLAIHPSIRIRIDHGYADRTEAYYT